MKVSTVDDEITPYHWATAEDVALYLKPKRDESIWSDEIISSTIKSKTSNVVSKKELIFYYAIKILEDAGTGEVKSVSVPRSIPYAEEVAQTIINAREKIIISCERLSIENDSEFITALLGDYTEYFWSESAIKNKVAISNYNEAMFIRKAIDAVTETFQSRGLHKDDIVRSSTNNSRKSNKYLTITQLKAIIMDRFTTIADEKQLFTSSKRRKRIFTKILSLTIK